MATTLLRQVASSTKQFFCANFLRYRSNKSRVAKNKPKIYESSHYKGQPVQDWWDYNGFGPYKYRHHDYPNSMVLRDVQNRRLFALHHEERTRLNAIYRSEGILPLELRKTAQDTINRLPRSSSITRLNRRCGLTGRARGIFHQYRVSRFIFRAQADYNLLSGVQRALWNRSIIIEP